MAKNKPKELRLSPSSLNLYLDCPRCFWLQFNKGIKRPSGPFPSLPGGMDIVIKKYFDTFRAKGELPPELEGKVEGKLLKDMELMRKWRNWRTGLRYEDKELDAVLSGALDDCLVDDGKYIPVDYKTRGFDLKADSSALYDNQLSCYNLLLEKNGYQHNSSAYLAYYIPKEVCEGGVVKFKIEVVKMNADPDKAFRTFKSAVQLLKGDIPPADERCGFCGWSEGKK
ncbi:MAG: PD-(D/E)XK nuclease family protein [Candidatus Margulisbacteria bacterium]|nr:PD-(D/E)XK nuclease family protein [Candidatus Margulisiibacteriota bacterium]MBU1021151.1 PD-(D/E)XK nuclease family protein [Candidatus Margulisiibacteriota bacterium]MBU1729757.1 PD-(D/E)XK nuclease family protein [Candidatus Margulisiibacteriota bacterium]MBU1955258.1 PD-(D/E)XK nuclease family protein [Candidatus Margulisiibacteriota bacterium]